jgi:putative phosphoribosyl transferase
MAYFSDRIEAGKKLAMALKDFSSKNGVVLAIPRGGVVVAYEIAKALGLPLDVIIQEEIENQKQEIQRRLSLYRQQSSYPDLKGLDVIVVDDGIATGSTMKAALASVRNRGACSITVAIPVGPPSTIKELEKLADNVVCLYTPEYFLAIGQFYIDFSQTEDEEVVALLQQIKQKVKQGEIKA